MSLFVSCDRSNAIKYKGGHQRMLLVGQDFQCENQIKTSLWNWVLYISTILCSMILNIFSFLFNVPNICLLNYILPSLDRKQQTFKFSIKLMVSKTWVKNKTVVFWFNMKKADLYRINAWLKNPIFKWIKKSAVQTQQRKPLIAQWLLMNSRRRRD